VDSNGSAGEVCDDEMQGRVMEARECGDKASRIELLLGVQARGRNEWRAPREHASQCAH
jgi:hypothetical protein